MHLKAVILSVVVSSCLTSMTVAAQDNSKGRADAAKAKAIEKEVLLLEEAGRQKILKGDNNWDDLIAENAYMIGYDGSVTLYQKGLQFPPLPVKSFEMSEMIVRVYGDAALVTGLAEVGGESAEKKPFSFKLRFLNVWQKSGDTWKIVVSERTGVKPPAR